MAILPRSSSLCFTFELFNLQLELALLGNCNLCVLYASKDRLEEDCCGLHRVREGGKQRGEGNMRVQTLLSRIELVDKEKYECSVCNDSVFSR